MNKERIDELENLLLKSMTILLPRLKVHKEVLMDELYKISHYLKEIYTLTHNQEYIKHSLVHKLFVLYNMLQAESGYLPDSESERSSELIIRVLNEISDVISVEKRYL
ncbi:hypothetical protein [Paenibacillus aceti]|uniref:Uncharacterized protein n=1 Tax=Paenibacillus aceti TaxID=1820010 RepID=A0ABQ1W0X4_9BACL|nr:hypothetical protein [Paenibacillus aceti]GGG09094.1 hypothetical protein GCM10010913_33620 [Paenibacillus aceti]